MSDAFDQFVTQISDAFDYVSSDFGETLRGVLNAFVDLIS